MRDRVLTEHGFQPFPKRTEEQAIKHGVKDAPADTGIPEPLIEGHSKAKMELALKLNDDAKKQAEMDKTIKERQAKEAMTKLLEEKAAKDALEAKKK